jgi:hypothetical protein
MNAWQSFSGQNFHLHYGDIFRPRGLILTAQCGVIYPPGVLLVPNMPDHSTTSRCHSVPSMIEFSRQSMQAPRSTTCLFPDSPHEGNCTSKKSCAHRPAKLLIPRESHTSGISVEHSGHFALPRSEMACRCASYCDFSKWWSVRRFHTQYRYDDSWPSLLRPQIKFQESVSRNRLDSG